MKPTPFFSIKSWMSKIHQPLPRTPRQSQQLLALLNKSFQHQLDIVHPPITRSQTNSEPPESGDGTLKERIDASRPTDRHFDSLLELPVFKVATETHNMKKPSHFNSRTVLEDASLHGRVTPELMAKCLRADENEHKLNSRLNSREAVHSSQNSVALQVVEIIANRSKPENDQVFGNNDLMRTLTRRLVDEGQSSVAWGWLQELFLDTNKQESEDCLWPDSASSRRVGGSAVLNTLISRHASRGELHQVIDEYVVPLAQIRSSYQAKHPGEDMQLSILRKGIRLTFKFIVHHGGFEDTAPRHFNHFLKYSSLLDKDTHTNGYHQSALLLYDPSPEKASPDQFCFSDPVSPDGKQPPALYFTDAYGPEFAMTLIERAEKLLLQREKHQKSEDLTQWLVESEKARSKACRSTVGRFQQGQDHALRVTDTSQYAVG